MPFCHFFRLPEFTYDGQLKILEQYRDNSNGMQHATDWTNDLFQILQNLYDKGILNAENIK